MQGNPKRWDLQEQPPINNKWDKGVEVGLKFAFFRINFHISKSFITEEPPGQENEKGNKQLCTINLPSLFFVFLRVSSQFMLTTKVGIGG